MDWPLKMLSRRCAVTCVLIPLLLPFAGAAHGQSYPTRPIRIIVPFSAGSSVDILARLLAENLREKWGQIIVENRPGLPGTASAAGAANDGSTLLLTSNGHAVTKLLNKNIPFDPIASFSGVAQVAAGPLVMLVPPDLPAKTVSDFVDLARQQPDKLNFASNGYGSTTYVAAALFNRAAGIKVVHVPYKGAPEALTAVIRGDAQVYFAGPNVVEEFVKAGKVRALGVTTKQRLPTMPELPTLEQGGTPGFSYEAWIALFAPAGIPAAIQNKINQDVRILLGQAEFKSALLAQGLVPQEGTPQALDEQLAKEISELSPLFSGS